LGLIPWAFKAIRYLANRFSSSNQFSTSTIMGTAAVVGLSIRRTMTNR
jgi:hypothetical protein